MSGYRAEGKRGGKYIQFEITDAGLEAAALGLKFRPEYFNECVEIGENGEARPLGEGDMREIYEAISSAVQPTVRIMLSSRADYPARKRKLF